MSVAVSIVDDGNRRIRLLEGPGYHEVTGWHDRKSKRTFRRFACDDRLCAFVTLVEKEAQDHFRTIHSRSTPDPADRRIVVTDASGRPKEE